MIFSADCQVNSFCSRPFLEDDLFKFTWHTQRRLAGGKYFGQSLVGAGGQLSQRLENLGRELRTVKLR